jgi:5-dehydro-2-deoxygluconokinase
VKGFAVGRTIFGPAARAWMTGTMSDKEATEDMAGRFARLCAIWDDARQGTPSGVRDEAGRMILQEV